MISKCRECAAASRISKQNSFEMFAESVAQGIRMVVIIHSWCVSHWWLAACGVRPLAATSSDGRSVSESPHCVCQSHWLHPRRPPLMTTRFPWPSLWYTPGRCETTILIHRAKIQQWGQGAKPR